MGHLGGHANEDLKSVIIGQNRDSKTTVTPTEGSISFYNPLPFVTQHSKRDHKEIIKLDWNNTPRLYTMSNTNNNRTSDEKKQDESERNCSTVMDLANFLSSELTMTMQTAVPKVETGASESERCYAPRRQPRGSIDYLSGNPTRNSMGRSTNWERASFADSTSSIETVKISNKQVVKETFSVSPNGSGSFSAKSLDDLASFMILPTRDSLTPMHRKSQSNMAA